jgi:arabinose-5-phosphate isomerase
MIFKRIFWCWINAPSKDLPIFIFQFNAFSIICTSNTEEILALLPILKRLQIPLISLTGNPKSELARMSDINLDVSVAKEACPLNLAPTASTTAALVMGDALALALLEARGYTKNDFALTHPSGNLGRRLLLKVSDLMHTGDQIPKVNLATTIRDALLTITEKRLGMTTITQEGKLMGVFTDGDIRRAIDQNIDLNSTPISELMIKNCKTALPTMLAYDALTLMEANKITNLAVVDEQQMLLGVLHMHDLFQAKVQ